MRKVIRLVLHSICFFKVDKSDPCDGPVFHLHRNIPPVNCNFQEEEVLLMADARAEAAARKAEAKLKKQREQEVKDADRDAAEMADLMLNNPEVRYVASAGF